MKSRLLILLLFSLPTFSTAQSIHDIISTEEKIFGLSKIWSEITYNFAFIDKVEFDLDSLYKATIPKVLEARTNEEYIAVLSDFLYHFENDKTSVMLNQWYHNEKDSPNVFLDKKEGKVFVSMIEENLAKRIPPNSEILSVDGEQPSTYLVGKPHSAVSLKIVTPKGDTLIEAVTRNASYHLRKGTKFNYLPVYQGADYYDFKYEKKEDISIVEINTFAKKEVVKKFKDRIEDINSSKGLIIDVSNNYGGDSRNAEGIAIHLAERDYIVGPSWKTRIHNASKKAFGATIEFGKKDDRTMDNQDYYLNNAWETHPPDTIIRTSEMEKIEVPIVILMSKNTVSAAEDFLIYTMGNTNITRIGQPSRGSSGQPLLFNLSNGVTISIVAKRDALSNGEDYIGIGIQPDMAILKTENTLEVAKRILNK